MKAITESVCTTRVIITQPAARRLIKEKGYTKEDAFHAYPMVIVLVITIEDSGIVVQNTSVIMGTEHT